MWPKHLVGPEPLSGRPTRRLVASRLLSGSGALLALTACGAKGSGGAGTASPGGGGGEGEGEGEGEVEGETGDSGAWATGGTAGMAASYPDPFSDLTETACALTCEMTLGPCYALTPERQDISEGYDGLPTRLALRVLDARCAPVVGAKVEVWHTSRAGLYSGDDAEPMCTGGDADAVAHRFFRGGQTTDSRGRVDFNTCFPGWYGSRTIHVHFTVTVGGVAYGTSQLFFDQALNDEICRTHPAYADRGPPATTNDEDGVLDGVDVAPYLLSTSRASDGVLIAWKDIVVRSGADEEPCRVGGPF